MTTPTPDQIDTLLPQTQCGLCGYNGCMPYATALANQEATINLCPPGGIPGLIALANTLNQDPTPYLNEMSEKSKAPMTAVIREAECIGCAKCIKACPVDAILGSGKLMHTVITDECTGCELCISPCPVDCIDMVALPVQEISKEKSIHYRKRYLARNARLQRDEDVVAKKPDVGLDKKNYIQEALLRAKAKREVKF